MESHSFVKPTIALPCKGHSMQWADKCPHPQGSICSACGAEIRDFTNWKAYCLECKIDLCDRCCAKKFGGKSGLLPLGSLVSGITATG